MTATPPLQAAFTTVQIWRALDAIAWQRGLRPSGLAVLAGLDVTSLNISKRHLNGKDRWPSLDSLNRILAATRIPLCDFADEVMAQSLVGKPWL